MTSHLVIANQTVGGERLDAELRERARGANATFHVLVPMIDARSETSDWAPPDPRFAAPGQPGTDAVSAAARRSRHRLEALLAHLAELGCTATGEVGDPDPVRAVQDVLERQQFDVVLVSTLPAGLSKWLKLDLPSRIDRMTDCPVVVVEARPVA